MNTTATAVLITGFLIVVASQVVISHAIADSPAAPVKETQATLKPIGSGRSQITLLPNAAKRLDIQTSQIGQDATGKKIAPYFSIIYDLDGGTWVYTVTAPLTYVRESVVIEHITRDYAYLVDGPLAGTQIVTVGVPELYGAEVGVNGE
jgi:hypothetical protein